jgi:RNA polymerase sigma factor (sigma-70 family)
MQQLQAAFTDMIQQHEKLVYKVCHLYAADAEDARDLFQEIVLQAWSGYARYRGDAAISTWLYRVALNTAITHKRKKGKHNALPLPDIGLLQMADEPNHADVEAYKLMHQMIAALPPLDKALVLLYLEERPHTEIGDILGISTSNVGTKLNRIKDRMRKQAQPFVQ